MLYWAGESTVFANLRIGGYELEGGRYEASSAAFALRSQKKLGTRLPPFATSQHKVAAASALLGMAL